MSERFGKLLVGVQALLLLVPCTLVCGFLVFLGYPPFPSIAGPAEIAFDVAFIAMIAGLFAGWRLAVAYLRYGRTVLDRMRAGWLYLLALGALIGLGGASVTVRHLLDPENPGIIVGFALLAPGALLAPLAAQLYLERRSL